MIFYIIKHKPSQKYISNSSPSYGCWTDQETKRLEETGYRRVRGGSSHTPHERFAKVWTSEGALRRFLGLTKFKVYYTIPSWDVYPRSTWSDFEIIASDGTIIDPTKFYYKEKPWTISAEKSA